MGWFVLYIAFGFVALWLLGEVLLQYKARLRWRLLAFTGFLGVVAGVAWSSVIVIAIGAMAFAVGQVQVTLSYRRGFSSGWAVAGRSGAGKAGLGKQGSGGRRRAGGRAAAAATPTLQVSGLEAGPADEGAVSAAPAQITFPGQRQGDDVHLMETQAFAAVPGQPETPGGFGAPDPAAVYAPQPMPDETGQYGIYSADARASQPQFSAYEGQEGQGSQGGQDGYGAAQPNAFGGFGRDTAAQEPYADHYAAYGDGQGHQAPYSDPYIGTQQYAPQYDPYEQLDPYGQPPYVQQQYAEDKLQQQGPGDTPPGGVWVPHQRDSELPPDQPLYPPQQPRPGYDGQQFRY